MRADKLLPRRGHLALGGRRDAVALEDIAHGLVADRVAQIRQSTHDTIVSPGAIFLRQTDNQVFQGLIDLWATQGLALLGTIKLLRDELLVPAQDGVGL